MAIMVRTFVFDLRPQHLSGGDFKLVSDTNLFKLGRHQLQPQEMHLARLAAGLRLGADGSLEEMRLKGPPHDLAAAQ
jgi:hypothetical protein